MTNNSKKVLSLIFFLILLALVPSYYFLVYSKLDSQKTSLKLTLNNSGENEEYSEFKSLGLTKADKFLVTTSDKRASQIGAKIIQEGGNAIDGLIAAQMVLNVVEPQASGIGGGAFLLYYDAKTKETHYFNGRETAPKNANSDIFLEVNKEPKNFHDAVKGGLSVGTPGLLKMLKEVHDKYGKLPWKNLFDEAIKIANEGFLMDDKIYTIARDLSYLKDFDGFSKIYLKEDGSPKEIGSAINNPDLAKTLQIIANEGIEPFYSGVIAQHIVEKVQNSKINPGYLSLDDLKEYKLKEGSLLCGPYRQFKVCSVPVPSSGGITLLQTLGILENFTVSDYSPSSVQAVHLISEASKLAYADRNKYVGDVDNVPVTEMLNKEYLKSRSELIKMDGVLEIVNPGDFTVDYVLNSDVRENPSTTHLSVIDKEGNAIAMTSSIEYLFGSAVIVDGFILNNQLTDFSFVPTVDGVDVANKLVPGKQPRSSMAPTFVFDENNNLVLIVGSPGGSRIIQYVLKTIIAYIDWNLNAARAVSLPNFVALDGMIELENGTALEEIKLDLIALGHKVDIKTITSGINAISIDVNDKSLIGSADFRRDGAAIGQ